MTVTTDVVTSGPYAGNGSQVIFGYTFPIEDESEIKVYTGLSGQAGTLLTLNVGYTVSGVNGSGSQVVTLTTAPQSGYDVFIESARPNTQQTDITSLGAFLPETHEDAFDKLTILVQQVSDRLERRGLSFEATAQRTEAVNQIPSPENLKFLQWTGDGAAGQLRNVSVPETMPVLTSQSPQPQNVSQMVALTGLVDGQQFPLLGYTNPGDGGGGPMWYVDGSTATIDNCLVFNGNGGAGRIYRVNNTGEISMKAGGATFDGSTIDSDALERVLLVGRAGHEGPNGFAPAWGARLKIKGVPGVAMIDRNMTAFSTDGSNFNIEGPGKDICVIRATTGCTSIIELSEATPPSPDTNYTSRSKIEGLTLDGNNIANHCISGHTNHMDLINLRFRNSNTAGTDLSNGWSITYDNCEWSFHNGDAMWLAGGAQGSGGNNNDVNVINCTIFANTGWGALISQANQIRFVGQAWEQNRKGALYVFNACISLGIYSPYFEANAADGETYTSPVNYTVKANIVLNGAGSTLDAAFPCKGFVLDGAMVDSGGVVVFCAGAIGGRVTNCAVAQTGPGEAVKLVRTYGADGTTANLVGNMSDFTISNNTGFETEYLPTHDGATSATVFEDSSASFQPGFFVNQIIWNFRTNAYGLITANTATTITVSSLSTGDFQSGDDCRIIIPEFDFEFMPLSGAGSSAAVGGEYGDLTINKIESMDFAQTDFHQWETLFGGAGTVQRSDVSATGDNDPFDRNPNCPVWELDHTASTTLRPGFQVDFSKHRDAVGRIGEFELWVKTPNDPWVDVFANNHSDSPNESTTGWRKTRHLFRILPTTQNFGIAKVGGAGTVKWTAPYLGVLGAANPRKMRHVTSKPYIFKSATKPANAAAYDDGDFILNTAATVTSNRLVHGWRKTGSTMEDIYVANATW